MDHGEALVPDAATSRRRPRRRGTRVAAIAVGLSLLAAACGDDGAESGSSPATGSGTGSGTGTTTTAAPQVGGALTVATYSEIFGLDPLVALGSGTSIE